MPGLTLSERVAAPRERVWDVFTNLELVASQVDAVQAIERIDGTGFHVGTKWRETRVLHGRETTEQRLVTAAERPERYVVESESQGTRYRTECHFEPDGTGTSVTVSFTVEPTGTLTRLLTPLTFKAMRKGLTETMSEELRALKTVAERDTAGER